MEHFKQLAQLTAYTPPDIWNRYLDDTFTKLHCSSIKSFIQHVNNINPHIKFTSDQEDSGKQPLQDTLST